MFHSGKIVPREMTYTSESVKAVAGTSELAFEAILPCLSLIFLGAGDVEVGVEGGAPIIMP